MCREVRVRYVRFFAGKSLFDEGSIGQILAAATRQEPTLDDQYALGGDEGDIVENGMEAAHAVYKTLGVVSIAHGVVRSGRGQCYQGALRDAQLIVDGIGKT